MKHASKSAATAALLIAVLAVGMAQAAEHPAAPGDLVAVASGAGNFKTLVAAIQAAGLVEALQGEGPFTVFAPTDEAFAKLPPGTLDELLKPENKAKLAAILAYHVVPGKVMAADVKTMKAKTVNGQELSIEVKDGKGAALPEYAQQETADRGRFLGTVIPAQNLPKGTWTVTVTERLSNKTAAAPFAIP